MKTTKTILTLLILNCLALSIYTRLARNLEEDLNVTPDPLRQLTTNQLPPPPLNNTITYTFATANNNSYMCSAMNITATSGVLYPNIACGENQFPVSSTVNGTVACPQGTSIKCLLYASYGTTAGSCGGMVPFADDASGNYVYLPAAVVAPSLGQPMYSFNTTADMSINGNTLSSTNVAALSTKKLEVLAYCAPMQPPITTNSGYLRMALGVLSLVAVYMI